MDSVNGNGKAAKDVKALAGVFVVSAVIHLVRPEVYEPIMPKVVPAKRAVVYASGVAELACVAGLLHPGTRRAAGWVSTALLLAVYPANLKMAADAQAGNNTALKAASLGRLPMQLPMLWTAYRTARGR